jgi:predicted CoA-binding protein
MIPVNPGQDRQRILARRSTPRLADNPNRSDMVDIYRASQFAAAVVGDACH